MMARIKTGLGISAAIVMTMAGIFSVPAAAQTGAKPADKQTPVDLSKVEKRDLIIFRTGNKVEGVILSETDTSVKMLVIIGALRSETTYAKGEILEIKRNEFKPAAEADKKDEKKDEDTGPKVATSKEDAASYENPVDSSGKAIDPGAAKVYIVDLRGEFGRDMSKTPVKTMMDDIVKAQPDVVVFRFDQAFAYRGAEGGADFVHVGMEGYLTGALVKALEIETLINPRFRDDPAFKKKPRVVAWIKKALGPAAFLPLAFKEIYYTSDAYHGGVGGLDHMLDGRGDEVVRQKQYSLRLSWVKGLAEQGGYDVRIAKAMCWTNHILSYRIVGGQVEFVEEMPPNSEWFLLKDDGAENKDRSDTMQDVVRMRGNDFLTLDAKTAFDIGVSRGTADSVDELMSKMGITRNYAVMKHKSGGIYKEWSTEVARAENEVRRLLRAYGAVEVRPPQQYEQRTAARTQRKTILRQIQSTVKLYREALNPQRIGDADGLLDQIDVVINQIETEQRLDRRP